MSIGFRKKQKVTADDELNEVFGDVELPTFPGVILEALDLIRRPDISASEVATALQADPGVTIRLLRLVNSAAFAPSRPVTTISQAVAIAGLGAVESMLLAVGVNTALPNVDVDGLNQRRFWQAAARRGSIAKTFAQELHPATAGESFTAGLLQDMAIPLLAVAKHDYRPLLLDWHSGGGELHQMEESSFGWSHDGVAALLCEKWEIPENIRDAIGGHHGKAEYDAPPAVELAAPFREIDMPDVRDQVVSNAADRFGLTPDRTIELIDQAEQEAHDVARLFA